MPPVKSLAERATQPKAQPKSAASGKGATGGVGKAGNAKAANKKRRGRSARPAKKTAEELDSEMTDYFKNNAEGANAGAATATGAAGATGDAPMEDEIMVCSTACFLVTQMTNFCVVIVHVAVRLERLLNFI
ncbi:RNA-binding RNA annealing protein [Metarhizium acridum]|nr:RNA-binding RNA annealing protein [Metarhizium acridum]